MKNKTRLEDYTEAEFLAFIMQFFEIHDDPVEYNEESEIKASENYERKMDDLVDHFEKVTEHPNGSDLLYYPEEGAGGPAGIISEVKKWRTANGKPGFKLS